MLKLRATSGNHHPSLRPSFFFLPMKARINNLAIVIEISIFECVRVNVYAEDVKIFLDA